MFVCCVCCMLSGRGLFDDLITRPEESYRLWRFVVCDQAHAGLQNKKIYIQVNNQIVRVMKMKGVPYGVGYDVCL
jgi:hypothetical protein